MAMRESMLGTRCHRALYPPVKYLWFTATMGRQSRNCVNAKVSAFSCPKKIPGSGHPIMCPMDR